MKEQKWIREGLITESLLNGTFRVPLDNENLMFGEDSTRFYPNTTRR